MLEGEHLLNYMLHVYEQLEDLNLKLSNQSNRQIVL